MDEWFVYKDIRCPNCGQSRYIIVVDSKDYRLCRCLMCNGEFIKLKHKRGNGY